MVRARAVQELHVAPYAVVVAFENGDVAVLQMEIPGQQNVGAAFRYAPRDRRAGRYVRQIARLLILLRLDIPEPFHIEQGHVEVVHGRVRRHMSVGIDGRRIDAVIAQQLGDLKCAGVVTSARGTLGVGFFFSHSLPRRFDGS